MFIPTGSVKSWIQLDPFHSTDLTFITGNVVLRWFLAFTKGPRRAPVSNAPKSESNTYQVELVQGSAGLVVIESIQTCRGLVIVNYTTK